jgi:hypothetical protein
MDCGDDEIMDESGISNTTRKRVVAIMIVVLALYYGGYLSGGTVAPIAYLWDRGRRLCQAIDRVCVFRPWPAMDSWFTNFEQ